MEQARMMQIARICHETNRAYCQSIGDDSQPAWDAAPEWQRASAINGVKLHWTSLEQGYRPRPAQSHEMWLAEKQQAGWTFAPVKNPERKEHPCMVPFEKLSLEQQLKDYLFCGIVVAFWEAGRAAAARAA